MSQKRQQKKHILHQSTKTHIHKSYATTPKEKKLRENQYEDKKIAQ